MEKKAVGAKVQVERDPPSPKQAKLSVTLLGLGRKLEWKPVSRAKRPEAFVRRRGALARDDARVSQISHTTTPLKRREMRTLVSPATA